jgi:hypothetical protein
MNYAKNVKFALEQAMKAQKGSRGLYSSMFSLISTQDGSRWLRPFYPRKRDPVSIV